MASRRARLLAQRAGLGRNRRDTRYIVNHFKHLFILSRVHLFLALGDHIFKHPGIYTTKMFLNSAVPFRFGIPTPQTVVSRVQTPPYLLSTPDVSQFSSPEADEGFLLLCSDGLSAPYAPGDAQTMSDGELAEWVRLVDAQLDDEKDPKAANLALGLLRSALGGDDVEKVSRCLTTEMATRWMNDMAIRIIWQAGCGLVVGRIYAIGYCHKCTDMTWTPVPEA